MTVLPSRPTEARFRYRWGTATKWAMVDSRGLWLSHGESGAYSLVRDLSRVTALNTNARLLLEYAKAQDASTRLMEDR
jgi:hypothetical protein